MHNGWLGESTVGRKCTEIGIERNDDAILVRGPIENDLIGSGSKANVTNVHRIKAAWRNASAIFGLTPLSSRNRNGTSCMLNLPAAIVARARLPQQRREPA